LLAEDVEINREILLASMEGTGAEIDCAGNGLEALRLLSENPVKYDLVFMDVQMPEMDGLEATRNIRKNGNNIPVVAMTANVFKEDIDKCLEAGMNDHLGKPLDMGNVLEKIRKYWDKSRIAAVG
jgi:CheY-like chemotaxis protein